MLFKSKQNPFFPSNGKRGIMRNGEEVAFWTCEDTLGFWFAGYRINDSEKQPELWRRNGLWREDGKVSQFDLLLPS